MSDLREAAAAIRSAEKKQESAGKNPIVVHNRLRSYGYEVLEYCSPPRPHTGNWWVVLVRKPGTQGPAVYRSIRYHAGQWQIRPTPRDVVDRFMKAPITANDNAGAPDDE